MPVEDVSRPVGGTSDLSQSQVDLVSCQRVKQEVGMWLAERSSWPRPLERLTGSETCGRSLTATERERTVDIVRTEGTAKGSGVELQFSGSCSTSGNLSWFNEKLSCRQEDSHVVTQFLKLCIPPRPLGCYMSAVPQADTRTQTVPDRTWEPQDM